MKGTTPTTVMGRLTMRIMSDRGASAGSRLPRLVIVALLATMGLAHPRGDVAAVVRPTPVESRWGTGQQAPQAAERYAVVVNPSTPASDVSLSQLRRIFRGEQQFWSGSARVVLFVQAPGTNERAVI